MTTPDQIRAARALTGLSQTQIADAAGVSSMTIKRAEGSGRPRPSDETILSIRRVFEAQGVQFLDEGDTANGVGVVLVKKDGQ